MISISVLNTLSTDKFHLIKFDLKFALKFKISLAIDSKFMYFNCIHNEKKEHFLQIMGKNLIYYLVLIFDFSYAVVISFFMKN